MIDSIKYGKYPFIFSSRQINSDQYKDNDHLDFLICKLKSRG